MTQPLDEVFAELGISQYLDAFVDQGFDSWETILDITESDLDALGVKLGHRRKLQRRIANSRGLAPYAALVSPTRPSIEDSRQDAQKPELPKDGKRNDATTTVVTKRKYRRHPKPDENAPERPPSAYVLFSNKMRDDLKGRNLTFTEIAKLVGENWQNLSQVEKEPYESQAQAAKDKYNHDLAEYKKTPEYRRYTAYLQDFKAKHANPAQEKDVSKRVKLSNESSGGSMTGLSNGISRSGTASGSDSQVGSEPPPTTRQRRVDSTASLAESQQSYSGTYQDSVTSPSTIHADHLLDRSPVMSTSPREIPSRHSSTRSSAWVDGLRVDGAGGHRHLPSLSDMFDGRAPMNGAPPPAEMLGNGFGRSHQSNSPGSTPSLIGGASRPSLRKENSSGESISSGGSMSSSGSGGGTISYPRTPIEGTLPIHALLSSSKAAPYDASQSIPLNPTLSPENKAVFLPLPPDLPKSELALLNGLPTPRGHGYLPGSVRRFPSPAAPAVGHATTYPGQPPTNGREDSSLDGISALLRARDIVERRNG